MAQSKRNASYLDSILAAIDVYERKNEGQGVSRDDIFKYCELNRTYDNKLRMLNQIRLALRRAIDEGIIVSEADSFRIVAAMPLVNAKTHENEN